MTETSKQCNPDDILTPYQFADELKISYSTLQRAYKNLPVRKTLTGKRFFLRKDKAAYYQIEAAPARSEATV